MKKVFIILFLFNILLYSKTLDESLFLAVEDNNIKKVKSYLEQGANCNALDSYNRTALINASVCGYDDIAKYLATFYSFIPEINGKYFKDEKNVENYKNTYLLKLKIQKLDLKYSFEDCVKKVLSGVTPDNPEVFGMIFDTSAEKLFKTKNEDGINALSNSIYEMYKVFVKSK